MVKHGRGQSWVGLGLLLIGTLAWQTAEAQCRYTVTDLGTNAQSDEPSLIIPEDINNRGEVVGYSWNSFDLAFVYGAGQIRTIDAYFVSGALGVNDRGEVVGWYSMFGDDGPYDSFLYSNGQTRQLIPGNYLTYAQAINNRCEITGSFSQVERYDGELPIETSPSHAFLYAAGKVRDLGTLGGSTSEGNSINNRGEIVGTSETPGNTGYDVFLYSNGKMHDLGNLQGFQPVRINDLGQIVGNVPLPGNLQHAFLYSYGRMHDLGTLPGTTSSEAKSMNIRGQIVGSSDRRTFLCENGQMYDLSTLIIPGSGVVLEGATAINDLGQIAAYGTLTADGPTPHLLLLTPVGRLIRDRPF
jgi:probable HAF family extracellular repeat protein